MLINCPNCGFSQPQDKYCAQCGVDMETYAKNKHEKSISFFGSTLAQVAIVVVGVAVASTFLYNKDQKNVRERIDYLRGKNPASASTTVNQKPSNSNKTLNHTTELPPPPPIENSVPNEKSGESNAASTGNVNPAAGANGQNLIPPNNTGDSKTKPAAVPNGAFTVHVYYTETNYKALSQIFEESKMTGQFNSFGDYTAGILPHFDKKVNLSNPQIKILHKVDKSFDIGKPIQWFIGTNTGDPESEQGFLTFVELLDVDPSQTFKGNLEIVRSFKDGPEPSAPIQKNQYPAIYEIPHGSGFFISGIMPHINIRPEEDSLMSADLFKILKSPQFKSKTTEFVVFIEFDRN